MPVSPIDISAIAIAAVVAAMPITIGISVASCSIRECAPERGPDGAGDIPEG